MRPSPAAQRACAHAGRRLERRHDCRDAPARLPRLQRTDMVIVAAFPSQRMAWPGRRCISGSGAEGGSAARPQSAPIRSCLRCARRAPAARGAALPAAAVHTKAMPLQSPPRTWPTGTGRPRPHGGTLSAQRRDRLLRSESGDAHPQPGWRRADSTPGRKRRDGSASESHDSKSESHARLGRAPPGTVAVAGHGRRTAGVSSPRAPGRSHGASRRRGPP